MSWETEHLDLVHSFEFSNVQKGCLVSSHSLIQTFKIFSSTGTIVNPVVDSNQIKLKTSF